MPGTIVVAATATGVQPPSALFVGGTNVLKNTPADVFGTPIRSIEVAEVGPGGVSSMEFTIDDPNRLIALAEGMAVLFWNLTANVPRFRGYVDHWSMTPDFGGQGRTIQVSCTGVEAWLDWIKIKPAWTSPGGGAPTTDFIAALATGYAWPLRPVVGATSNGAFATPIGKLDRLVDGATAQSNQGAISGGTPLVVDGSSLREALLYVMSFATYSGSVYYPAPFLVTVDFYLGLRVWPDYIDAQPDDYTTLTVTDTAAGTFVAENLQFTVEPGDATHEAYIAGTDAAGSGWVSDGTGLRGRQEIVTGGAGADIKAYWAREYFAGSTQIIRGSLTLSDFTPPSTVHAGSLLALTDAATGATGTYRIYQITKTFLSSGRETWSVAFGGLPASAMNRIRQLTRAVA